MKDIVIQLVFILLFIPFVILLATLRLGFIDHFEGEIFSKENVIPAIIFGGVPYVIAIIYFYTKGKNKETKR